MFRQTHQRKKRKNRRGPKSIKFEMKREKLQSILYKYKRS